jgi:hypothetical protein
MCEQIVKTFTKCYFFHLLNISYLFLSVYAIYEEKKKKEEERLIENVEIVIIYIEKFNFRPLSYCAF